MLKFVVINAEYNVSEHLYETTICIVSETFVSGSGDESLNSIIIQAEVEDRVHHTRHTKQRHRNGQRGGVGFQLSPNFAPSAFSNFTRFSSICLSSPVGYRLSFS